MDYKLIAIFALAIFVSPIVFAAGNNADDMKGNNPTASAIDPENDTGNGSNGSNPGLGNNTDTNGNNQTISKNNNSQKNNTNNGNGNIAPNGQQKGIVNSTQLKEQLKERERLLNQSSQGLGEKEQKIYQNQNQVRLAVHAFLAMENLSGGIGQNISQIARDFNNSVNKTIQAEEKIQNRNSISRMFFGGDEDSANTIEAEINQNRVRIQELNRLIGECDCDDETKQMLQEQLQNMEQEQDRLQQLAQEEKTSRGLLGWLWK